MTHRHMHTLVQVRLYDAAPQDHADYVSMHLRSPLRILEPTL